MYTALMERPLRVLISEDEQDIASLIKLALERDGKIQVEIASTGDIALKTVLENPPNLVVLDLNLPILHGTEVLRILQAQPATSKIPIIVLTARTSVHDRITHLEAGAVDYVTKPFDTRELVARIRGLLKRERPLSKRSQTVYENKLLQADFEAIAIRVCGKAIQLTRKEFEMFKYLVGNRHCVLSRQQILEHVWGLDHPTGSRAVDVHMGRLRTKLGPAGTQIETVIGLGYRFTDQNEASVSSYVA